MIDDRIHTQNEQSNYSEASLNDNVEKRGRFGCKFAFIYLVFVFIIALYIIYKGVTMNVELNNFTNSSPSPVTIANPNETEQKNLEKKIFDFNNNFFKSDMDISHEISLELTVEDINNLIASYDSLSDLRGFFWLKNIKDGFLESDHMVSFNGFPIFGKKKYLNCTSSLLINFNKNQPEFFVKNFKLNNKKVIPEFFLIGIRKYLNYSNIIKNPKLSRYINYLSEVQFESDRIKMFFRTK